MAKYKCKCKKTTIEVANVTIRVIAGLGCIHDVQCASCGEYMELANPKPGECAGFTSNNMGQL
jgi:hypothetical protein